MLVSKKGANDAKRTQNIPNRGHGWNTDFSMWRVFRLAPFAERHFVNYGSLRDRKAARPQHPNPRTIKAIPAISRFSVWYDAGMLPSSPALTNRIRIPITTKKVPITITAMIVVVLPCLCQANTISFESAQDNHVPNIRRFLTTRELGPFRRRLDRTRLDVWVTLK